MNKLTKGILNDIKSTRAEYNFDPADFSSDIDSKFYNSEEELFFKIGVISYCVIINIDHTWDIVHSGGNGYGNPSEYEIVNEETEIQIKGLFVDGDEMDFKELEGELTSHIYGKYI